MIDNQEKYAMNTNYPPATLLYTHTRTLHSNIVHDDYELSIWLPPGYESSDKAYPTLYVLDAPFLYGPTVWSAFIQSIDADVPEMIVVGIGRKMENLDAWWSIRWRDYSLISMPDEPGSGHGETFLKFIGQELIPFIDANYCTQSDDRILWGESMSGSYTVSVMFSQTNLFNRYIASAPSFYDRGQTLFDFERALATGSFASEVRLFVCVGELDKTYGPGAQAFMKALAEKQIPNLKFRTMIFEGLGHTAAAIPGFVYGIEAVYKFLSTAYSYQK
jgi:predicted alpha/beta superfamily hydrolase